MNQRQRARMAAIGALLLGIAGVSRAEEHQAPQGIFKDVRNTGFTTGVNTPGVEQHPAVSPPALRHSAFTQKPSLVLRSAVLEGPADTTGLKRELRISPDELSEGGAALLKFQGPLLPRVRAATEERGIRLVASLGSDACIAWLPRGGLQETSGLPGLAWVAPYHPGLRIAPEVAEVTPDDPRDVIPITIHLFAHTDVMEIAGMLEDLGLTVRGTSPGALPHGRRGEKAARVVITPTASQIVQVREEIACWRETLWIGRRPAYRLLNDNSAWVCQSGLDRQNDTPVYEHGLFGDGQVIAFIDTGLDADMCYFHDDLHGLPPTNVGLGVGLPDPTHRKVLIVDFLWSEESPANVNHWDTHGHGTHVAGSIAGDDPATPGQRDPGDGMAPAAKLVVQDGGMAPDDCADIPAIGCPAADLVPFFNQAYQQGARIHSNSWGDRENFSPENIYSDGCEDADSFMWEHPDSLIIFSAGNSGQRNDSVHSPATAKNVLSVGGTRNGDGAGSLYGGTSFGNTHDGRLKPDVMAPALISSAGNDGRIDTFNCSTAGMSGTSMAASTTAGLAALVREYFQKGYYPSGSPSASDTFTPTAALLKAALIASATPVENVATPPPCREQGWGRILLDDVLFFPDDTKRLFVADVSERFASSDSPADSHDIMVFGREERWKVVLVWTDYPSTPVASTNLVNDLNLEVTSPAGVTYKGNVFSGGLSKPGGSPDSLNNVEAVFIDHPDLGVWTVTVSPFAVPQPSQGYALVITGQVEGCEDTDDDGIPDHVEDENGLDPDDPEDAGEDLDGDGLTNLEEVKGATSMQSADSDGDGIPDGAEDFDEDGLSNLEEFRGGTGIWNPDADADGLLDGVESNTGIYSGPGDTGTDPLKFDTDSGGRGDGVEVARGKNPLDPGDDKDPIVVDSSGGAGYTDIQSAIDTAADGDTVLVKPGEYVIAEPINFKGKAIIVKSEAGAEATTIRMSETPTDPGLASVVLFENGESNASVLEGFTLAGGRGTTPAFDWLWGDGGGGVLCKNGSSPVLTDCTISGNSAEYGGGVCCDQSSPTLMNCTISGNSADQGGGVYCNSSSAPTLANCTIVANSAWWGGGGGVCCDHSSPTLTNCTISGNSADQGGGGGVWCVWESSPILMNCTLSGNSGGGVFCQENSSPTLTNCILWANSGGSLVGADVQAEFVSGGSGGLYIPTGMMFGADGNLHVCSWGSSQVLKYDGATGAYLGEFASGSELSYPGDIECGPDGYVYVTNSGWGPACTVRRHDPVTGAFLGDFVPCQSGGLQGATYLLFRETEGSEELLVSNYSGPSVLRYDGMTGAFIDAFVASGSGGLSGPQGLSIGPDGNLYVCSLGTDQVLRYEGKTGAFLGVFVEAGSGGMSFAHDAVSGPDGHLYVASAGTAQVLRFDGTSGAFMDVFASGGGMVDTHGLLFGPDGHLYVAGREGNNVLRYDGKTGVPLGTQPSRITATRSCIEGQGVWPGEGNVNGDPLFLRPGEWMDCGSADDPFCVPYEWDPETGEPTAWHRWVFDYRLQPGSPAIDAGTCEGAPATDIEGTPRPQGAGCDIGAYEYVLKCPEEGDTHCLGLAVEGPEGGGPGTYVATATAEDDSGDSISYTFSARRGDDAPIVLGPQAGNAASFDLGEGTWTVSVEVDDDPECPDLAADAACSVVVVVPPGGLQRPGDVNQDGKLDLSDAVWLLGHLFLGTQPKLPCEGGAASSPGAGDLALADVNGDEKVDLSDPVSILGFLFLGGKPPILGTECVRIAGCPQSAGCVE